MPTQTVAARKTCRSTSPHGRCVRHWISPSPIWASRSDEHDGAEVEEARRAIAARREVAEAEEEGQQEDPHDRRMDVDDRLQASQAVDLVGRAAAGVRAGRGRKALR